MKRKRFNGRLEDRSRFLSRATCSQACGNTKSEVKSQTLHWRARRHRAEMCKECGATAGLHVHHLDRNPANNEPTNLVTLCGSCHLKLHWREDRPAGVGMRQRSAAGS
jgi:5-methylcytosine-specific restriction endonuclease McrA